MLIQSDINITGKDSITLHKMCSPKHMLRITAYFECGCFQGNRLHRGVLCAILRRLFVTERWFFIIVIADDGFKVWLPIVVTPIHKPDSKLLLTFLQYSGFSISGMPDHFNLSYSNPALGKSHAKSLRMSIV
jgi:hypothetical protein